MDNITSTTILCQGGLDTTENHLVLDAQSPGAASELVNYEVGLYGGYKRIDGFTYYDEDNPLVDDTDAEGPILGIFIYKNTVIAARKQKAGATYKFYEHQSGTGWIAYTTGLTLSSAGVSKIRHLIWTFGAEEYIAFTDGVNPLIVFNGTTWYQLDSTGAGTSGDPGGNQMIDAPAYIEFFNNTIFISGDSSYPGIVAYSAPEDIFNWTAAGGGGQILSGFNVVQLKTFRESLYVLGRQRLRKIILDSTDFVIKDVANDIGCIASDSVIEINGDVIFLAQDGIRTISGTDKIGDVNLASISKQIQKLVNDIQDGYDLSYLNSVLIRKKSQFRYFVSSGDDTSIGVGIIGGLRASGDSTSMEYSQLLGIRVSSATSNYLNDVETILHGDFDGSVYQQENGNTFNGNSVFSLYATPFLTFGDILTRKQLRKIHVFTKYSGLYTLGTQLVFDWNNPDSLEPNPFSSSVDLGNSALYGTAIYGTAVYESTDTYPIFDIDVAGSFKSIKIKFTTSGDNYPHTIQGIVFEFTPQGKRGP